MFLREEWHCRPHYAVRPKIGVHPLAGAMALPIHLPHVGCDGCTDRGRSNAPHGVGLRLIHPSPPTVQNGIGLGVDPSTVQNLGGRAFGNDDRAIRRCLPLVHLWSMPHATKTNRRSCWVELRTTDREPSRMRRPKRQTLASVEGTRDGRGGRPELQQTNVGRK